MRNGYTLVPRSRRDEERFNGCRAGKHAASPAEALAPAEAQAPAGGLPGPATHLTATASIAPNTSSTSDDIASLSPPPVCPPSCSSQRT